MYQAGTLAHDLVVLLECRLLPPPQLHIPVQLLAPTQCFAGASVGCFDVGEYVCPLVVGDVVDGTAANTVHRMHHALNCYDISIQCHVLPEYDTTAARI